MTMRVVLILLMLAGCVPQRQTLIQPACLLLCQANDSPVTQGDLTELLQPPIGPVPELRRPRR